MDEWLLDITRLLLDPPVLLQWVVGFLASWRLSYLLVHEDGPWEVFDKLRRWAINYQYDDHGRITSWRTGPLPAIFRCVLCISFWTTPLVYAILWAVPPVAVLLGTWGAASYLETLRPKD